MCRFPRLCQPPPGPPSCATPLPTHARAEHPHLTLPMLKVAPAKRPSPPLPLLPVHCFPVARPSPTKPEKRQLVLPPPKPHQRTCSGGRRAARAGGRGCGGAELGVWWGSKRKTEVGTAQTHARRARCAFVWRCIARSRYLLVSCKRTQWLKHTACSRASAPTRDGQV